MTASCGTVTAFSRVERTMRALTNSPGHSGSPGIVELRFETDRAGRDVDLVVDQGELALRQLGLVVLCIGMTSSGSLRLVRRMSSSRVAGTVKLTKIGLHLRDVTRLAFCAVCTRLPTSTRRCPVRPSIGARTSA